MAEASTPAPVPAAVPEHATEQPKTRPKWQKYGTPLLVALLAAAVVLTITRNWNAWEGGRIEQVTDDAYVRGDLTPLSTKIAGIVRDVKVFGEVTVPHQPFRDERADRRSTTLFTLLSCCASLRHCHQSCRKDSVVPHATIRPGCHECWRGHLLLAPFPAYK